MHGPGRLFLNPAAARIRPAAFDYVSGTSQDATSVASSPTTLFTVTTMVHDCSVSFSVNPLNFHITQNPLSFIQDSTIEPKPIAANIYTG